MTSRRETHRDVFKCVLWAFFIVTKCRHMCHKDSFSIEKDLVFGMLRVWTYTDPFISLGLTQ